MYRFNSTFKQKPGFSTFKKKPRIATRRSGFKPVAKRMARSRHSPEELRWSKAVRERDNFTCQFPGCNKGSKSIDTHHIAPRSLRPDLKFSINNGVALCRQHHNWVPANREQAVEMGLLNLESYEIAQKRKAAA